MGSWQRRARLGIGVFAIVFGLVVFFAIGEREQPAVATPPERLDSKAIMETRGGDVIQLKGARQDVRVEFAGQVSYEDGQSKLLKVKAHIDNRAGRSFVVTGNEGRLGKDQSAIDITGDVTLTTSDGLTAKAGEAHYVEAEGIVKAPGPVQFQRGRMTGSGVGFTYDKQRDTIWLLDQAVVRFAAEGDLPAMEVTAGAAGFARAERYMRFERSVKLVREGQIVEGDDATVRLLPDRDEPDAIEIRGNSRITGGTGTGSLQAMQARDINLDYALDGRTLERVALVGQGRIQISTTTGKPGQQLAAEWIDVTLAPDGAITSLASRESVRVTLPPAGDGPARAVSAVSLNGSGAPGQGLTAMHFAESVEFREAGGQGRPSSVARSRTLDLVLAPGSGDLQDARFTGAFRFEEGNLRASSASAVYQVPKGVLGLSGRENDSRPRVEDARLTVDADAIEVTLAPRRLAAQGAVASVLQAGREGSGRTSLLSSKEAVFVTASKLSFDEEKSSGVYSGQARLWQGDTVIRAETIALDDRKGDLTAVGQVVTNLPLASGDTDRSAKPASTIARAAEFRYDDASRRATYTKGAQVNGPDGDLSGDRIELLLAADQNALDRLEANGSVRAIVDRREATGVSLTYHPSDARYVLVGAPVKLIEECRETTGKTLTFFRASDRILIDGNEETRTQTRGGTKCPDPRFE